MDKDDWFAGRLKELRAEAALTQAVLAERAGLHRVHLAQLEAGKRRPSWDTVRALAKALGVDCLAFDQPPTTAHERKPGRPRKTQPADAPKPRRKRP